MVKLFLALLLVAAPRRSAAHDGMVIVQNTKSVEEVAFQAWIAKIENGRRGTFEECVATAQSLWIPDGTFIFQSQGQVLGSFPNVAGASGLAYTLCAFLQSMANSQIGLVSVEHCNGKWRGSYGPPFFNATGNILSALIPNEVLETNLRPFLIDGFINAAGDFIATNDTSCIGYCRVPEYEWPCNNNCLSWCSAYTCGLEACKGCSACDDIARGEYCASWCNSFTCGVSLCAGCSSC